MLKSLQFIAVMAAAALAIAAPAHAQGYPTKPITIVSAQASGGASDNVVRAMQERLQAALGQPIVLENRPGASGNVGAAAVARSAPDGHTLMVGTDAMMTSNVHLFKSMPFDPVKDFAPITNAGANIIVMAVHADVPAKSVAELIAHAKANPGKVQFGTSGVASPHHLAGELLKLKTGTTLPPIAVARCRRTIWLAATSPWRSQLFVGGGPIPTGKVKFRRRREDALRGAARCADSRRAVPGFEMSSWLGFFAPAGIRRRSSRASTADR